MASKTLASLTLIISLDILLFSLVLTACGSPPNQNTTPTSPPSGGTCPRDVLKFGVCADVLGSVLNLTLGTPPVAPCCSLLKGLVDLEVAVCLCTAVKANILGINLNLPVPLSLILNVCSKNTPRDFQCA